MQYKDHLVPTGRLNDVGAYTRVNVDRSHRIGVETSASFNPFDKLNIEAQATLSSNKIESFNEYIDNWATGEQEVVAWENTDLAFSPDLLASLQAKYTILSNLKYELSVDAGGRYIGKQYADNTSREASSLDPYVVADAGIHWTWFRKEGKEFNVGLMARNVLNESYESNGWIYRFRSEGYDPTPDDPYAGSEGGGLYHQKGYFPQAGRYLLLQMSINF
jgi:iron complex outermembrane receptor protein